MPATLMLKADLDFFHRPITSTEDPLLHPPPPPTPRIELAYVHNKQCRRTQNRMPASSLDVVEFGRCSHQLRSSVPVGDLFFGKGTKATVKGASSQSLPNFDHSYERLFYLAENQIPERF